MFALAIVYSHCKSAKRILGDEERTVRAFPPQHSQIELYAVHEEVMQR